MKNIFSLVILAVTLVLPAAGARFAHAEKKKLNACGCYGEGNNCTCTRNKCSPKS